MSFSTGGFRHEIKLLLTPADYRIMRSRLSSVMEKDRNAAESGDYFIRSLYLDDVMRTAYFEKLSGVADRKKYRVRIYNLSDSAIKLECKEKRGDRIKKRGIAVSRECADKISIGDFSGLYESNEPLSKEILSKAAGRGLRPSVVVDYDREAYVHPAGNVRLTFDKALHAGISGTDIFDGNLLTVPVFPDGSVIFEVKYDGFIPKYLAEIVSSAHGSRLALSKFCLCRDALAKFKPKL